MKLLCVFGLNVALLWVCIDVSCIFIKSNRMNSMLKPTCMGFIVCMNAILNHSDVSLMLVVAPDMSHGTNYYPLLSTIITNLILAVIMYIRNNHKRMK